MDREAGRLDSGRRRRRALWGLARFGGILTAIAMALMNFLAAAFACAWDTSSCGKSRDELAVYRGTITDHAGRPVGHAKFHFRNDLLEPSDKGPVFESNADGSYCVMWPHGSGPPFAEPPVAVGPRSYPAYDSQPGLEPETSGCHTSERRGAWHRYENLTSTWQFWLLMLLPAAAVTAFCAAGRVRSHDQRRKSRLMLGGALLLGLNVIMYSVLWSA